MHTQRELEAYATIAEDLEHLRDEWWEDPSDAVIRRGSGILRRFLAENLPQRAWKAFGFEREPIIVAANLDELLGPDISTVELAFAGGANLKGVLAAGGCINKGNQPPTGRASAETAMEHPFKLSDFIRSTSLVVKTQRIKRLELVKYFAHEKGGVHLDGLSSRRRKEEDALVRRLLGMEKAIAVFNKDAFFFELLSIGQAVGRAPEMQKLIAAIRAAPIR